MSDAPITRRFLKITEGLSDESRRDVYAGLDASVKARMRKETVARTFEEFHRLHPDPATAMRRFEELAPEYRDKLWAEIGERCATDHEAANALYDATGFCFDTGTVTTSGRMSMPEPDEPEPAERPPLRVLPSTSDGLRDTLAEISAEEWVPRLLRVDVPPSRKILCPWHEERTPSCHVGGRYAGAVHCFGCGVTADLFKAAGLLWDLDPSNPDHFKELLSLLASLFGLPLPNGGS